MSTRNEGPVIQIPRMAPSEVRISILGSISSVSHIDKIKIVQRKAARFVTNTYSREPGNVSNILHFLGWPTLETRKKGARLILLYKILHGEAAVNILKYVRRLTTQTKQHHKTGSLDSAHQRMPTNTALFPGPSGTGTSHPSTHNRSLPGEGVGVHGVRRGHVFILFSLVFNLVGMQIHLPTTDYPRRRRIVYHLNLIPTFIDIRLHIIVMGTITGAPAIAILCLGH